jgi:hydrogenase maturation factor
LRDPLTGERVLVAGADIGQKLLGLTAGQLSDPADTLAAGLAPGMRLIPYRTVGQRGAMMLARRFKEVKIGSWQGSALVAFAPDCFGKNDGFQMLIGG